MTRGGRTWAIPETCRHCGRPLADGHAAECLVPRFLAFQEERVRLVSAMKVLLDGLEELVDKFETETARAEKWFRDNGAE